MRGMNLNAVKASILGRQGGSGEALNQRQYFCFGKRNRHPEVLSRQAKLDRRRCLGMRIDERLCLPSGVTNLHPDFGTTRFCCIGPCHQRRVHLRIGFAINHHIARTLQMKAINLHIAGEQNTTAAG